MKTFDEQLLRLKQVVKVTADQEVAALLGMTKAAFSERKKRGAFPEDKLWALATQRPDLDLDALYILNGIDTAAMARLQAKQDRITAEVDKGREYAEVVAGERAHDAAEKRRVKALLQHYYEADESGKKLIEGTAALAAQADKRKKA